MKRFWSIALATFLIPTLMFGCGSADEPAASDAAASDTAAPSEAASEEAVTDSEPLVMATEPGFPPYEYYDDNNEIVGVDVDIAREIAAELGRELVIEHMEFSAITAAVNSGKADFGAAGMSVTEERLKEVDFSVEYATSKQMILTTADSDIQEAADLTGKTVGVQLGTVADLALSDPADYPDVSVERYNKYMEAANDLIAGRIDAIVLDVLTAEELVTMDESLVIREKELFTDVYAFCVQKGNTEMLDAINTVMQRLLDEGKVEEYTKAHMQNAM